MGYSSVTPVAKSVQAYAVIAVIGWGPSALAQSLADVARKEEARRKTIAVPGRVYTNSDLRPEPSSAPIAAEPEVKPPETRGELSQVESKGEAHWKALMRSARAALERSQVLTAALQSRLNALAADIAARDNPAQRSKLEAERRRVLAELDRVNLEIAEQTKEIATIEEDARKAGVPPGWLR